MAFKSIGLSLSNEESGDIDYTKLKFKVAKAVRISSTPKIDGIIDEVEWSNSIANESFLQQEPYNLADPTVRTQSRVMYDDNFLYIAFNNFDPNIGAIERAVKVLITIVIESVIAISLNNVPLIPPINSKGAKVAKIIILVDKIAKITFLLPFAAANNRESPCSILW